MHTNERGITLKECPICGSEVEIDSGSIVCGCGINLPIYNFSRDLQKWIDKRWNDRYYDSNEYLSSSHLVHCCDCRYGWHSGFDRHEPLYGCRVYTRDRFYSDHYCSKGKRR